ncbi:Ribonuclease P protein subunit p14 [Geranomyces variabilis]|uniref:Ribonuclease P protein subunit p14 n=1 Tax=Geranomyces variabilis TaxID=109894 RepID=A0AAD5TDR6_9FUNG|nr:Ribonuclease P protein subunit p14 [Geranomyces variabilis]
MSAQKPPPPQDQRPSPLKRPRSPSPAAEASSKKPAPSFPAVAQAKSQTLKFTISGPAARFQYLRIRITHARPGNATALNELHFRSAINHALRETFGLIGASHHVDLLKFDAARQEGLVRTPYASCPTLRAALTLMREYQNNELRADVLDSSPFLFSIAHNSRVWKPVQERK